MSTFTYSIPSFCLKSMQDLASTSISCHSFVQLFARYIAILLSYFTGYDSLPCNIQFLTQLPLTFPPNKLQSVSGSQTGKSAIKHILCIPANTTVPVLASPSEVHKGNTHHRKCHNKYHVTTTFCCTYPSLGHGHGHGHGHYIFS